MPSAQPMPVTADCAVSMPLPGDDVIRTVRDRYGFGDGPVHEWLPAMARALGAKPPRHVPAWLVRPLAGQGPVDMMTRSRGICREKAKRELGWTPRYPSWRTGFVEGLS